VARLATLLHVEVVLDDDRRAGREHWPNAAAREQHAADNGLWEVMDRGPRRACATIRLTMPLPASRSSTALPTTRPSKPSSRA
jgi:hypothetical protein